MAKQKGKVYIGYEEESIGDKNLSLVNYTVNKIGGFPDWPPLENLHFSSKCPLCGLHRVMVVQCYAPLENSVYHRTLYVFACVSPNCWNQSESWKCVRSQIQDKSPAVPATVVLPSSDSDVNWCDGADEWDENDNDAANGNIMNVDNAPNRNGIQRNSDEEEESSSFELENVEQALGNLQMFDAHNANMSPVQGAEGAVGAPAAAAELEGGDEPGLVTVDTPTAPSNDIQALLHQTAELPLDLRSRLLCAPLQFVPKFIFVEEEWNKCSNHYEDKVTELLNRYKRDNAEIEVLGGAERGAAAVGGGSEDEVYEEAAPLHGDRLFHAFVTRLRDSPGQILRYSRTSPPLLGAPLPATSPHDPREPLLPPACTRCGSPLICELQLVPEFANSLRLLPGSIALSHLHFLSVLIFTCAQSCWQPTDTLVSEIVIFQPEVF